MQVSNVSFNGSYIVNGVRAASRLLEQEAIKTSKTNSNTYGNAMLLSEIKELPQTLRMHDYVLCATNLEAAALRDATHKLREISTRPEGLKIINKLISDAEKIK